MEIREVLDLDKKAIWMMLLPLVTGFNIGVGYERIDPWMLVNGSLLMLLSYLSMKTNLDEVRDDGSGN